MNSSNTDLVNDLNNIIIYIYRYIVLLCYIVGNIGNLMRVLIFSKKNLEKNVCVFYLFTVTISKYNIK